MGTKTRNTRRCSRAIKSRSFRGGKWGLKKFTKRIFGQRRPFFKTNSETENSIDNPMLKKRRNVKKYKDMKDKDMIYGSDLIHFDNKSHNSTKSNRSHN